MKVNFEKMKKNLFSPGLIHSCFRTASGIHRLCHTYFVYVSKTNYISPKDVPSLSNQMCYFWGSVEIMRTYIRDPAVFISFGTISEPATCWASRWESQVTISKLRGENQYAAELQTSVYMSLGSSHFVLFTDLSGSEKSNVCHVRTESGDDWRCFWNSTRICVSE